MPSFGLGVFDSLQAFAIKFVLDFRVGLLEQSDVISPSNFWPDREVVAAFNLVSIFFWTNHIVYFAGVQLDSKTKEIEWNPEKNFAKEEKEDGMPIPRHSLMIKQAIL